MLDVTDIDMPSAGAKLAGMPRKKRSPTTRSSTPESGGHAAAVVRKIVELHRGKRTVTQKLRNSISRPLLIALCNGERATTPASVAELCRVCPEDLAAELVAAHLQDELARIQGRYASEGSLVAEGLPWSGKASVVIDSETTAGRERAAATALAAARRLTEPFPDHKEIRRKAHARRKVIG